MMLRLTIFCITLLLPFMTANAAIAETAVSKVILVENGWYGEGMAFQMTVAISGCSVGINPLGDQYMIEKTHPSYKELTSMLLAAYTTAASVSVTVDTGVCPVGRTKVLSIKLRQ
jgi:hypothetical protein